MFFGGFVRTVTLFRGWSLIGCYISMFIIGLLMSIYGPIVTIFQGKFDLTAVSVGAALGVQSCGAVIGVLLAQPVLRKQGNRTTVMGALLFTAVGSVTIAFSSQWTFVLIGTAIAGLGFGVIDSVITQLVLIGSGDKGPRRTNIAHAWFGIGTVAGPALIFLVGSTNYSWVFCGAAGVAIIALISLTRLEPYPTPAQATSLSNEREIKKNWHVQARGALVILAFFVLYLTHFAVQAGIGNWGPTIMQQESGLEERTATLFISGFWAAMVLGRFGAATLTRYLTSKMLVILSAAGLTLALAITMIPSSAPFAYGIAGFFLGPIFPTGLAWLSASGYGRGNTFAFLIAGSMLGMAIAPSLLGWQMEQHGSSNVAILLLLVSILVLVSALAVMAFTNRAQAVTVRSLVVQDPS